MPRIITLAEARARGLKHFFNRAPCTHGHLAERFVSNRQCVKCALEQTNRWRRANREACRESVRRYQAANREKVLEVKRLGMARWRAEHPEEARERDAKRNSKRAIAMAFCRQAGPPLKSHERSRARAAHREAMRMISELKLQPTKGVK
jgi:hypothetical protein